FKLTRTTTSGQFRQLLSLRLPIFRGVAGDKLSELIRQPVILDDELPLQVTGLLLVLAQPFVERLENLLKFRISLRILELLLHLTKLRPVRRRLVVGFAELLASPLGELVRTARRAVGVAGGLIARRGLVRPALGILDACSILRNLRLLVVTGFGVCHKKTPPGSCKIVGEARSQFASALNALLGDPSAPRLHFVFAVVAVSYLGPHVVVVLVALREPRLVRPADDRIA